MRHAGSLLLSLFLAPLIWVGTGYGLTEVNKARVQLIGGFEIEIVLGLLALLAAGGLYALLTMARLSPIGPALIGLVFVVLAAWAAFDPSSYFDTMPTDLRDGDFALTFPALGYSAMLAVPLLATLLSPRRWRRYAQPAAATPAAPAPYPMPAAGMPPGAVPAGSGYPPHYGGQPTFAATPGYLAPPPTTAFPSAPQAPTSAPPVPSSAPPSSAPPAPPPIQRIPAQAPPRAEQEPTTVFGQPPAAPLAEAPTTRIPTSPTTAVPAAAPPAEAPTTRIPTSPTTAAPPATPPAPPPAGGQTTTRIGAQDTEATQLLKGPPPKDAYPRPAWSAPTPPPITPPGARKPEGDLDDPEATQPR